MNENVGSFYGNQGMVRGGYANLGNSFLQPEYINAEGDLPPELGDLPAAEVASQLPAWAKTSRQGGQLRPLKLEDRPAIGSRLKYD